MLNKKIETIIIKYFSKSASIVEMIELTKWINKHCNELIFKEFIKTNYLIDINILNFDTEVEKEKILKRIKRDKRIFYKNKVKRVFKYVAALVIGIGIGYMYISDDFSLLKNKNINTKIEPAKADIKIEPGIDKAILTLENGSEVVLGKGKSVKLKGLLANGKKLVYETKVSKKNIPQYNYLTIPRGGHFFVQLSDGTKVWLNSDSKLKYMVNFIEGQTRNVELVYGEAYFDVSQSINHNGDSFKVKTRTQEIEVLGTEFNIKAYRNEDNIYTTLVEGKVTVSNGIKHKFLKPSEQSLINTNRQGIIIRKVDKLFDEIAWKNGYFSFKHKSMKEIMKTLSRWYDTDYIFKDSEKENKVFTGVLDRESTIDQILTYIQMTNEISFQIKNKTVIIE